MKFRILPAAILATMFASFAAADVTPAALFGDHMVLQQDASVPVWGTAAAGEAVTVTFGDQKQTATADAGGKWMVHLTKLTSGGPAEMTIAGKNSITIKDILVGEVWVGSGQSNMQFPVSASKGAYAGLINEAQEIAAANYPKIRMFTVRDSKSATPLTTLRGTWEVCSPETVPGFSAVGYLFARDLQKEINLPVGIVTTAVGASTAESWISREALVADPLLKPMVDNFDAILAATKANPQATMTPTLRPPWPMNKALPNPNGRLANPVNDQHEPTVDFNGMVNPVIPYAMRGVIWYQGESVCWGDAGVSEYGRVQATLIKDWRTRWGEGDFPFYIVQLPGQQNVSNNPRLREQQGTVLQIPNTAMAVIIDTGEAKNVHPHNKAPLGERLTKIALANLYGRKIEYSGPVYDSMKVEGGAIRVSFNHIGGGLVAKGGPLKWFRIAGADQKFVDADARIDGETVIVSSPQVSAPVAVRYAWDNFPDGCNLWNAADIPASPFRTDSWTYPLVGLVEWK
jgi:sialate O-acetylesterase